MTVDSIVVLLNALNNDMQTHLALFENFKDYLSDSPIADPESESLKNQYITAANDLKALYMIIVRSCADWLKQQP